MTGRPRPERGLRLRPGEYVLCQRQAAALTDPGRYGTTPPPWLGSPIKVDHHTE